jgi:divalent metal cation (Fe/Co/Zn/Cd) transporter
LELISTKTIKEYYRIALILAVFTIGYNFAEGLISVYFGAKDDTLALFGFGLDSFIETISGLGILHMVMRIITQGTEKRDKFEKTALRITGTGFYVLTAGLMISAGYNFYTNSHPETTVAGIVISLISILLMYALIYYKTRTGKALQSEAILADASCSKVCLFMSLVLLASSGLYEIFHWGGFDALGGLGLAWFSINEGRECFEKATKDVHCSCH